MRLPTSILPLLSLCLVTGCSTSYPMTPGAGWPFASNPPAPAVVVVPVAPPVASAPVPPDVACRDEAYRHRLDVPGDEGLSIGQAYRRCMGALGARSN